MAKFFTRAGTALFALVFCIIFLCCLPELFAFGPWPLAAPLLLAAGALVWQGVRRVPAQTCRLVFFVLLAAWAAGLYFLGLALRVEPAWDFGWLHRGALDLSDNWRFDAPETMAYFATCPNNFPPALLLALWFKIASLAGIAPAFAGILLNALALACAVGLLGLALARAWGWQGALLGVLFCFGFAPLLLYAPIYYTDTLSLPFVSFAVLAGLMGSRARQGRAGLGWGAALGLAGALGYLIKATAGIAAIAAGATVLLAGLWGEKAAEPGAGEEHPKGPKGHGASAAGAPPAKGRGKSRPAFAFCGAALLCAALALGAWRLWFLHNPILPPGLVQIYALEAPHYIMMGLAGRGGYNEADHFWSAGFADAAARRAANWAEIRLRLAGYGPGGLLAHLREKLAYTWADGSYFAPHKLATDPVNHLFIAGLVRSDGALYPLFCGLAAAAQAGLLGLLAFFGVRDVLARRACPNIVFCARLALAGLALFLLLWETRSRYLVNFSPLLVLLAAHGVCRLSDGLAALLRRRREGTRQREKRM